MRLRNLLPLLALIPVAAIGGTITRVNKDGSGTGDWANNEIVQAAEINGDFNAVFNEFNGNITNINISAGAAIDWTKINATNAIFDASIAATAAIETSKIDGYSDNATELKDTLDAEVGTLPATLQQELRALRYAIQMLNGAETQNGGTLDMEWYLKPARGINWLANGDFEDSADGNLAAAPYGWALLDCSTITNCDTIDTDTSEGVGHALNITSDNDGVDDGMSHQLAGLKAGSSYLAVVRAKAASSGTCQLITTGGTTNANATTTSATYVTLADIFSVAAGPGTVGLQLTVNDDSAGSDICNFDHAAVYEMKGDNVGTTQYLPVYKTANSAVGVEDAYTTALLTAVVTVPGPKYAIKVTGEICAGKTVAGDQQAILQGRITESLNGGAATEVAESDHQLTSTLLDIQTYETTLPLLYVNDAPTPGTTYSYVLQAQDQTTNMTFNGITNCGTIDQKLLVELIKVQ